MANLRSILCRFPPLSPSQIQLEHQAKRAKRNSMQFTPCINVVLLLFHTCQEYACVPATGQHVVVVCMHGKNERMAKFHSAHIKMSIGPCEKGQYLYNFMGFSWGNLFVVVSLGESKDAGAAKFCLCRACSATQLQAI